MSNPYLDIYIRVSTAEQKKSGNSLSVQEDMGRNVAKKLGLEPRIHNEGARSSTIQYREVLQELKYSIRDKKIKHLWIMDRSRLFRDMTDSLLFRRDFLEKYRMNLYEGDIPTKLNLDSPSESFAYNVLSASKQMENEERQNKSIYGKLYKLKYDAPKKPVYLGGTPLFGYMTKDKLWTINKGESKWVKFIFDSYEKSKTTKEIKDHLDKEGVAPRRTKNSLWNLATLQNMLQNQSYTGIHRQHIKKVDETFSYKVPKIINVGQFNRVQKLINKNQKYKDNAKKHYSLLGDFLVCECGRRMGSRHLKSKSSLGYNVNTRTYYCLSKHYDWKSGDGSTCNNVKSLQMDSLNDYVMDFVKERVSKSHLLKEKFRKEIMDDKFQKMKDIKEIEKKLEQKIQRFQNDIDSIENNIVELEVQKGLGERPKNIVQKIITRYEEELESKNKSYEETEKAIDDLGKDKNWLNWMEKYGERIEGQTSNEEKQKEFLQGVVEKITIKGDYGKNKDGKSVHNGHRVHFSFKMKIVEDKYEVIDPTTTPRTYRVIDGKRVDKSEEVMKFISKRNRVKKKKKVR